MSRMSPPSPADHLVVHPVTPDRWPDLEGFCGPSGLYGNCWCVWWRRTSSEFEAGIRNRGRGNRQELRRLTVDGAVPGLLAYDGDRPIGWASVGPREQFGRVLRSPQLRPDESEDREGAVWSVVCFYVHRADRGRGISRALLDAAVSYAAEKGARTVEGYPVDTTTKPASPAELYTGTTGLFLAAGFREVRHRGGRRHVVQRPVGPGGRPR